MDAPSPEAVPESPLVRARSELLRRIADRVLHAGFDRARYWEYGDDVATDTERLVLSYRWPDTPGAVEVGYSVDAKTSTLALLRPGRHLPSPALVRASLPRLDYLGEDLPVWVDDLNLRAREWVEVNVVFQNYVFGVLAADNIEGALISEDQLRRFADMALELGMHLTLILYETRQSHDRMRPADRRRSDSVRFDVAGPSPPDKELAEIAADVSVSLDASCAAVFRYMWDIDALSRIASIVNTPAIEWSDPPPELYSTIDTPDLKRRLTGHAWKEQKYRLIMDFEEAKKHLPDEVDAASERWHLDVLGGVQSMLFVLAGESDGRYLLRFVNRRSAPTLPFLYERKILDELMASYADDLRSELLRHRLDLLRDATEQLRNVDPTSNGRDEANVVSAIEPGLRFDGISNFALFSTYRSLEGVHLIGSYGTAFASVAKLHPWFAPEDDALLARLIQGHARGRLHALDLREFSREKSQLAVTLSGSELPFRQLAVIKIEQGDHNLFGVVPLRSSRKKTYLDQPGTDAATRALQTYCQLAANALSTRNAQLLAAGARRALGLIVHEIRTPITLLADTAEEAIAEALQVVERGGAAQTATDFATDVRVWRRRIKQRRDQVTVITRLSVLLAQESVDQTLQMHIKPHDLYHLVGEIADDMEYESRTDPNLRLASVDVRGCQRLSLVNCDAELMRVALTNVIRNGVKYSLPPGGGADPVVTVSGSVDGRRAVLEVGNFGFGIPEDIRPSIFDPFVRGEIQDERKAIRGMGLGLFLAKRICEAHNGDTRLVSSRPALGDQRRLKKNEGYRTLFRLWVDTGLAPGSHEHTWRRLSTQTASH